MTRYPICNEDKDHIIGFLHIKDLLRALNDGQKPDLSTLARDVLEVPVSMPISNLLRLLQKEAYQQPAAPFAEGTQTARHFD